MPPMRMTRYAGIVVQSAASPSLCEVLLMRMVTNFEAHIPASSKRDNMG